MTPRQLRAVEENAKPLCLDLYCGQFWGSYQDDLGVWRSPFAEKGFRVVGYDLMNVEEELRKESQ